MSTLIDLEYWSDFPAASGAVRLGYIDNVIECTMSEAIDGSDSMTLIGAASSLSAVTRGMVVRGIDEAGNVREYRVRTRKRTLGSTTRTLTGLSARDELARAGVITQVVAGVTGIDIAGSRTYSEWMSSVILPFLSSKGYTWFAAGTNDITSPIVVSVNATGYTPLSLLLAMADASGAEVRVRRNGIVGYYIDFVAKINSTANKLYVESAKNLLELVETEDDEGLVSAIMPLGESVGGLRATLSENAWVLGTIPGSAPYWIPLTDPDGGAPPIAFDAQFGTGSTSQQAYLLKKDATLLQITDSRKSDSAVLVSATTGLTAGDLVQIVADSSGNRLIELTNPAISPRNAKVGDFTGRGERNVIRDGTFAAWTDLDTPTRWTPGANCWVTSKYLRNEPTTISGVTATRDATSIVGGGPNYTRLIVSGAPANFVFHEGEYFTFGAVTFQMGATQACDGSGAATITVPANAYAAGPSSLVFATTALGRVVFPDDGLSPSAPLLMLQHTNTQSWPPSTTAEGLLSETMKVKYLAGLSAVYAASAWTLVSSSQQNSSQYFNSTSGGVLTDDPAAVANAVTPGMGLRKGTGISAYALTPNLVATSSVAHSTISCGTTITADTDISVVLYGARQVSGSGLYLRSYCRWVTVWLASSTTPGPISDSAKGNLLWQRTNRELAARALGVRSITLTLRELSTVVGYAVSAEQVVLGGDIYIEDLGLSVRVVSVVFDMLDPQNTKVTLDSRPPSLVRYLAEKT